MEFALSPIDATMLLFPSLNTMLETILVEIVLQLLRTALHVLISLEPAPDVTTDSS